MSVVILQDEIVHYEVLGRGRPLIFLHGWVGSWRYWIPTMQAVSITFRAYALDLWGFGDTAKEASRYSITEQTNLVVEFMDKMGLAKVALVGHGLGALVALNYAIQHVEAVDRLMVINSPLGSDTVNPRLRSASPAELAEWLLGRIPTAEAARIEVPKTDPKSITMSLDSLHEMDMLRLSMQINTSCLFVYGQNDPALTVPSYEVFTTLPERTHQILLEQSGHFPMLEESSKFNRLLADFLSLPSGVSPRQLQLKEEWKRRVR